MQFLARAHVGALRSHAGGLPFASQLAVPTLAVIPQNSLATTQFVRFATKKAAGSTGNRRDTREGRRLGVRKFDHHKVKANHLIVKQIGSKFHAGDNVIRARDFTLHAACDGRVRFEERVIPGLGGHGTRIRRFVHVDPATVENPLYKIPATVRVFETGKSLSGKRVRRVHKYTWEEFVHKRSGGMDFSKRENIEKFRARLQAKKFKKHYF